MNNIPKKQLKKLSQAITALSPIYLRLVDSHAVGLSETPDLQGSHFNMTLHNTHYTLTLCANDIASRNALVLFFQHINPQTNVDETRIDALFAALLAGHIIIPAYFSLNEDGRYPDIDTRLLVQDIIPAPITLDLSDGSTTQASMPSEGKTDPEQSPLALHENAFLYEGSDIDSLDSTQSQSQKTHLYLGVDVFDDIEKSNSLESISLSDDDDMKSKIHTWYNDLQSSDQYNIEKLKKLPKQLSQSEYMDFCEIGTDYLNKTKPQGCLKDAVLNVNEPILLGCTAVLSIVGLSLIFVPQSLIVATTPILHGAALFAIALNPWIWLKNESNLSKLSTQKLSTNLIYHAIILSLTGFAYYYSLLNLPIILASLLVTPFIALGLRRGFDHETKQTQQLDMHSTFIDRFNTIPSIASLFYIDDHTLEIKQLNPSIF